MSIFALVILLSDQRPFIASIMTNEAFYKQAPEIYTEKNGKKIIH